MLFLLEIQNLSSSMKTLINILTLFVFTLGTIQFSNVVSFCKMMEQSEPMVFCACSKDFSGSEVSLSSEEIICCSVKKFDKDKVQDFTSFKDEISKLISYHPDLKNLAISPEFSSLSKYPTFNILPLKFKLPILNSSLLI